MKTKTKLAGIVIAFMLALSAMVVGIWAVSTATVNLGGNISFTADDIYAKITGKIENAEGGEITFNELNYSATTEGPSKDELATWTGKNLNFADKSTDIVITITIQNLSSERKLKTIIKDTIEETQTETNLEKSVSFTNDGQTVATENAEGLLFEIPAGEGKTATYQITLHIKDKNKSVQAVKYDYDLSLYDENVDVVEYNDDLKASGLDFNFDEVNKIASAKEASTAPTGSLIIPSIVIKDGVSYTVTSIAKSAFEDCSELTSVTIPNSVTMIETYAFSCCSSLTSMNLPDSITTIGDGAFASCSSLQSLRLPKSLTKIASSFVEGDELLSSIEIPESVTSIGDSAFSYCSSLTSITIPDGVTSIGSSAFKCCDNLDYREDNNGLYLGNSSNEYLVLVKAKGTSITNCEINNNTKFIHSDAFNGCTSLNSINIPDSVTSIGVDAFSGCSSLSSVTIGNSVTSIGNSAFYNCSGLTSIEIPNSVTSIGSNAFSGCNTSIFTEENNAYYLGNSSNPYLVLVKAKNTSITSCEINNKTKFICSFAFNGCSGLISIEIPNSVTSIGDNVFFGCNTSIFTKENNGYYLGNSSNSYLVFVKAKNTSITSCEINNKTKFICPYAFNGCRGLTSIEIPNSVTSIGDNAFDGCRGLTSIEIPNSVTSIGDLAFTGCSSLQSITIPNSVTSIGSNAFSWCSGLTSVTIGNSVTSIGDAAFSDCSSLTSITINAINPPTLESSAIPSNVTDIYVPSESVSAYQSASVWSGYVHKIKAIV